MTRVEFLNHSEPLFLCWKCEGQVGKPPLKVGFRATCPHCEWDLHCCKNCKFYAPGKPNDCMVPGTDFIRDREKANFCEEFQFRPTSPQQGGSSATEKIFGADWKEEKKNFNSLFKDE